MGFYMCLKVLLYSLLTNYLERRIYCSNGPNDVRHYDGYDKNRSKSSQIKQEPYRSSGFIFKCDKRAGFIYVQICQRQIVGLKMVILMRYIVF